MSTCKMPHKHKDLSLWWSLCTLYLLPGAYTYFWSLCTLHLLTRGCTSLGVYVPCVYLPEEAPHLELMSLIFTCMVMVELKYHVFTHMPHESYQRQLGSLLLCLCLCSVFRVLINRVGSAQALWDFFNPRF